VAPSARARHCAPEVVMLRMTGGLVAITAAFISQAVGQASRYELFPMPDVRQASTNWVNSAYVVDKNDNQFWICTARYNFSSQEANKGECMKLSADIGRPSLTEKYVSRAVTGSTPYGAFLPVLWFIEPSTGDVQFCAVRHAGICIRMSLQ
jgi:hypothetical protein